MHHIRDCLPEIKSKLNVMMQSVTQELTELGHPTDDESASSLGATLVSAIIWRPGNETKLPSTPLIPYVCFIAI